MKIRNENFNCLLKRFRELKKQLDSEYSLELYKEYMDCSSQMNKIKICLEENKK